MSARIPVVRWTPGQVPPITDATAQVDRSPAGGWRLHDFRDLDGLPLILPPGARLEVDLRAVQAAIGEASRD